jgi:serine/threonine protein kinase
MQARHNPIHRLLDPDYHESFDLYAPVKADFYERISSKLPEGWEIKRRSICFYCGPARHIIPEQGWKIHISATRANACEILDRVGSILFAAGDSGFKFVVDVPTLFLVNGKSWPRGGSGKFITIYPRNKDRFRELIEQLHAATREFCGPYILSDHRYKDSQVVFYRYGGMRLRESLDVTGEKTPVLLRPDGTEVPDCRMAFPATPAWAEILLPIPHQCEVSEDAYSLREGRFQIEGVINFSSAGGVYRGTDRRTGSRVIVKEARPCIEMGDGQDAVALLKKEYRLLTLLADTSIAPQPVDLFQEETHWFLAEEYINGVSLHTHSALHNILLRTRPVTLDFHVWYETFRDLALRLIDIVRTLHRRNVVFSDLSPNNLLVTDEHHLIKLIDFEGAYQLGVDEPSGTYTPGFVSQRRLEGAVAGLEDDYYSLGAVLMAYLLPVNGLFHLKPEAKEEFMASIQCDAQLPKSVAEMILALMEKNPTRRPAPARLAEMLPANCAGEGKPQKQSPTIDYACVLSAILQHILQSATYSRHDRLFPADPKLFATNPLSLAYGACGIVYAVKRITGSVPHQLIDWILAHEINRETYAPGLYMGMSGIAWVLLETGERKEAERVFELTFEHRLLDRSFDLFYGLAGWGLTSLRFFLATGDEVYLQKAVNCGARLLEEGVGGRPCKIWEQQGDRPLGLAHGASGVALYLLYLYLTTREERFLAGGMEALASDVAAGKVTLDGGLSWGAAVQSQDTVYPYWRHGSAGIGAAVLRYNKVLQDDTYCRVLDQVFIDTDRKYAVLPGRFMGLAGIGDFLIDAWAFTGKQAYLDSAQNVAEAVLKFSVNRNGTAFPGDFLSRLCCDYGTGSAGIALFLNRLHSKAAPDFLLDDLLGLCEPQQTKGKCLDPQEMFSGAVA